MGQEGLPMLKKTTAQWFQKRNHKNHSKPLVLEKLEERIECATRLWNGSQIPFGNNIGPVFGDPTFSSALNTLATNWDATLGQILLPVNGDDLLFPDLAASAAALETPVAGVFENLTRPDPLGGPLPIPISVNLINDLARDSSGNLPAYLPNGTASLDFVNQVEMSGTGYYLYSRDYPQFGPASGIFPGPQLQFFPATGSALPLNVRTQWIANYAGDSTSLPSNTNADWVQMHTQVGAGNSDFTFNVAQEGSWLVFSNRINGATDSGYTVLSDVNNNKIIKRGLGTLVFDGKNSYQGITLVENGLLVVAHDLGLGDASVNSNAEVSSGATLRLSSSDYSQNAIGNLFNGGAQVNNRNLVLTGGDGYAPTLGTAGISLNIPQGQLDGKTGSTTTPNQWNGTITLVANPSAAQTPGAPNPFGDASLGQQFGSTTELNGVLSGSAGLRKWGMGTVELTQANTFTGNLAIYNGFLNGQNNLAFGSLPGNALRKDITVKQVPVGLLDPANPTPQFGALTLGDQVVGGQNLVFGPQYRLIVQGGNGPDQDPGAPFTATQRLEGLGSFQIVSPASQANTADWQGEVIFQNSGSLGGTPGGTLKISGAVTAPATATVEKRGSNTAVFAAANPNLLGNVLVSSGNLQLSNSGALMNASSVTVTQTAATPPALSGAGSIQVSGSNLTINKPVTIGGTGFTGLGALQSIGTNSWQGTVTLSQTASLGAGAGSELALLGNLMQTAGAISSKSVLIKIGAGTVRITGPTTFGLPVSVQEGTLVIENNTSLGTISGSSVTVSTSGGAGPATLALQNNIAVSGRTLNLDGIGVAGGGALRSFSGSNSWAGNITLAGAGLNAAIGVDQGILSLTGKIDGGSTTLEKVGSGILVIGGSGNSQALSLVSSGTLVQNGIDNVPITIRTGGALQGSGQAGAVTISSGQSGILSPGNGANNAAIFTVGNLQTTGSSGVFQVDLLGERNGSPVAGIDFDQVQAKGLVSLGGSLSINLGFSPTKAGTVYTIIGNDGSDAVQGAFTGLSEGATVSVNSYSYVISYKGGDGNDVTLAALGIVTSTTISTSDPDGASIYGQNLVFTAAVNGGSGPVQGGTVQFLDGGSTLGAPVTVSNGIAALSLANLQVSGSPHLISAKFNGNGVLSPNNSANSLFHSVSKATSSIQLSSPFTLYGNALPITFTALVTPQFPGGPAGGTVAFEIDGINQSPQTLDPGSTNSNGARTASLNTVLNALGTYQVKAQFLGDGNVNPSGYSQTLSITIVPASLTTTELVSSENPSSFGDTITFSITTRSVNLNDGVPLGDIVLLDGANPIAPTQTLLNGQSSFFTSTLPSGMRTITANYIGGPNSAGTLFFAPSSVSITQIVGAQDNLLVVGANAGGGPQVNVYNRFTGAQENFYAFDPAFRGGVRVATGDVNGDGVRDIIVGAGPGGGPNVRVFDGNSKAMIRNFFAYAPEFTNGIYVASGDLDGDGFAEIMTGAGKGGGPHIQVFDGKTGATRASFFAYSPGFRGGITLAAGDLTGDGIVDLVVGAGEGGGPHVKAYNGAALAAGNLIETANFFAFDPGVRRGVFVASGDYDGDGLGEIVVSAGPGGGPHVRIFQGSGTGITDEFFAYDLNFAGGVTVGMVDSDGDGIMDVVTAPLEGRASEIKLFSRPQQLVDTFFSFPPAFLGGAFVS